MRIRPRPLSKSAKKTYETCPKKWWYNYMRYPDEPYEVGEQAIEGLNFHEYGEIFNFKKFHGGGFGDREYFSKDRSQKAKPQFIKTWIDFQTERREKLTLEEFIPIATEIYVEMDDIKGYIDYVNPVFDNGKMVGLSIGEIKPSRKNYSPKWVRGELAFYVNLLERGIRENGISEYFWDTVAKDYKRDESGDPIPYPFTIPDLPITHWEVFYYAEPLESAHWMEKIQHRGKNNELCDRGITAICDNCNHIVNQQNETLDIINCIETGKFPVWTRDPSRKWMGNPLCPEWCNYAEFCNPNLDGFTCLKCFISELVSDKFPHTCNHKE